MAVDPLPVVGIFRVSHGAHPVLATRVSPGMNWRSPGTFSLPLLSLMWINFCGTLLYMNPSGDLISKFVVTLTIVHLYFCRLSVSLTCVCQCVWYVYANLCPKLLTGVYATAPSLESLAGQGWSRQLGIRLGCGRILAPDRMFLVAGCRRCNTCRCK